MGWRSTIGLAGLVIIVVAYVWFADAPPNSTSRSGSSQERSGAESAQTLPQVLAFVPADVVEVQLERAGKTLIVQWKNATWDSADASAVDDFLRTLSELKLLMEI